MTEAPAAPVPTPSVVVTTHIDIADKSEAAKRRLREFINRSAAQHMRQMRKEWGSSRYEATR